jgi:uncharacterized protein (DUF2461 family)
MYVMAADRLARYRRAVDDDAAGAELEAVVAKVESHGFEVTGHERLKSAPRGYPKDHRRIELLRNKGIVAWKQWPVAAWLGTAKAKDEVVGFLRAAQPLDEWLERHVGATTEA